MKLMNHAKTVLQAISAAGFLMTPLGCGDDINSYQGETLTIENPISSKHVDRNVHELSLSENSKSDFSVIGEPFGLYPWTFPFWDYYTDFAPFAVPVNPGLALVEPIHPFYAFRTFGPFLGWGDDDGGPFDDDNSRCDDDGRDDDI